MLRPTVESDGPGQPRLFTKCCARINEPWILPFLYWASLKVPMSILLERLVWRPITPF